MGRAVHAIDPLHPSWPSGLTDLERPPERLWLRGSLPAPRPTLAIVGTRRATTDALDCAYRIARDLSRSGALVAKQSISTLPPDFKEQNITAEIRVHPNGRFVYGSNRGHDSIAVFAAQVETGELTLVEIVKTGGRTPRNFALSPDGQWLVCGHQDTPILTVFRVDASTGQLARIKPTANVPACVCVEFFD